MTIPPKSRPRRRTNSSIWPKVELPDSTDLTWISKLQRRQPAAHALRASDQAWITSLHQLWVEQEPMRLSA